jgi:NitT/TauT family transport system ATP-binding protein
MLRLSEADRVVEHKALDFDDVTCTFQETASSAAYNAIGSTAFTIDNGEFVSMVGPTGCGKSTLLNLAAGLISPSSGRIEVFGNPVRGVNTRAGYLFQADALMPWRNAIDNIAISLIIQGVAKAEALERAQTWLSRVGLAGAGERLPHQLSGGMRKRVALAQTLSLDRPILLMDEPFSALDIQTRHLMENQLLDLWSANRKSVLFITHDLEEAISLSDRVVVLSAGPASSPVAEFRIDLPRPRDVAEIRLVPRFVELHSAIWAVLREEVLRSHARTSNR